MKFLSKNLKKIFQNFLLTILLLVVLCTLLVGYNIFKTGFSTENTNIKYYHSALLNCRDKEGTIHFPAEIPPNAKDIYFYSYSSGLGGQTILLHFKIDEKFIQNEMDNHSYNKISTTDVNYIFSHGRGNLKNFSSKQYTFYELKRKIDNNAKTEFSTAGYSGIATDNSLTQILYYYINPEW